VRLAFFLLCDALLLLHGLEQDLIGQVDQVQQLVKVVQGHCPCSHHVSQGRCICCTGHEPPLAGLDRLLGGEGVCVIVVGRGGVGWAGSGEVRSGLAWGEQVPTQPSCESV
jgi:hypothetical protein